MFGINFGFKKSSSDSHETMSSTDVTNQTQNSNETQGTKGTQNTQQSGTSSSTGSSNTTGAQTSNESQTGKTKSQTTQFSDQVLGGIQDAVTSLIGGATNGSSPGTQAANGALDKMNGFDPAKYVSGVVDSARSDTLSSLEEAINGNASAIGGTAATNSSAALLAGRLENNRAAALAGIESDATAKAQGILASQVASGNQTAGVSNDLLTQLAAVLKGGVSGTSADQTQSTTGGTTTTSGTTTAENQVTQQNTNTQTQQDILTQILATLQGTENKTGVTDSKGHNTSFGGGASASFGH